MHSYQVKAMSHLIAKYFDLAEEKEIIINNILSDYWKERIAITWTLEDIISCGSINGIQVTETEAHKILGYLLKNHDANIGINWEVIEEYLPHKEKLL